ncbi:MAG: hypothetical protein ACRDYC_03040, partial [Acidimicrobiales bacterium]
MRESSLAELLQTGVSAVRQAFDLDGAALLLPEEDGLHLAASAGDELTPAELSQISARGHTPVSLGAAIVERGGIQAVALSASGRAIGLLALRGLDPQRGNR